MALDRLQICVGSSESFIGCLGTGLYGPGTCIITIICFVIKTKLNILPCGSVGSNPDIPKSQPHLS